MIENFSSVRLNLNRCNKRRALQPFYHKVTEINEQQTGKKAFLWGNIAVIF